MSYFLRELSRSDIHQLNQWRNDRDAQQFLVNPFRFIDEEVDEKWFDSYLASRESSVRLMICEADSQKPLGTVYLFNIDWVSRSCYFAIWVAEKDFRGRGVGEFATRAIMEHAFKDMNLRRIHLGVLVNNERAIALYKKVGFVEEGVWREAVFKNGRYVDLIQMGILVEEYQGGTSQI